MWSFASREEERWSGENLKRPATWPGPGLSQGWDSPCSGFEQDPQPCQLSGLMGRAGRGPLIDQGHTFFQGLFWVPGVAVKISTEHWANDKDIPSTWIDVYFYKEDIWMADTQVKRCPISLVIGEMQIKTTMRGHLTPLKTVIIRKSTTKTCWQGCQEKGTLVHCWWEYKLVQPLWRTVMEVSQKTKNKTTIGSRNTTPGYISTMTKNNKWKRFMLPSVHRSIIYNCQDMEEN